VPRLKTAAISVAMGEALGRVHRLMPASLHFLISLLPFAIVVLIVVAILRVFLSPTATRLRIFRFFERRKIGNVSASFQEPESSLVPLPLLHGTWLAALLLGLSVTFPFTSLDAVSDHGDETAKAIAGLLSILSLLLALIAFVINYIPGHSRPLKYTIGLISLPLFRLAVHGTDIAPVLSGMDGWFWKIAAGTGLTVGRFWFLWIAPAVCLIGHLRSRARLGMTENEPSNFERYLFAFARMRGFGVLAIVFFVFLGELFIPLMMLRYVVVERFRRNSILYLRSFSHDEAAAAFGAIIAPALARYGVIRGLVHERQKNSFLMSRVSVWQFGLMTTVPDPDWREWVSANLKTASLAIVDCSLATESVRWELACALSHLPPSRVVVINSGEALKFDDTRPHIIEIDTSRAKIKELRRQLARFAEAVLFTRKPNLNVTNTLIFVSLLFLSWLAVAMNAFLLSYMDKAPPT
jgi:hypothetical protein